MGMKKEVIDRISSAHRLRRHGPVRGGDQRTSLSKGLVMSHLLVTPTVEAECSWERGIKAVTSAGTVKEGIIILSGNVPPVGKDAVARHRLGCRGPRGWSTRSACLLGTGGAMRRSPTR
jgi:hypothetical protein